MDKKTSHIEKGAVGACTTKLKLYSDQLDAFKKGLDQKVADLGQVHVDQNFGKFHKYYTDFWPEIEAFKKDIEKFNAYLFSKIDLINNEYEKIVVKKPK